MGARTASSTRSRSLRRCSDANWSAAAGLRVPSAACGAPAPGDRDASWSYALGAAARDGAAFFRGGKNSILSSYANPAVAVDAASAARNARFALALEPYAPVARCLYEPGAVGLRGANGELPIEPRLKPSPRDK